MTVKRLASVFLAVLMLVQCGAMLHTSAAGENTLIIAPNPNAAPTVLYHETAPGSFAEGQAKWKSNTRSGVVATFVADGTGETTDVVSFYNNHSGENGLPEGQTMEFVFPVNLNTAEWGGMELVFRYVMFTNYVSVDQSDDFQVYASTDGGKTWSASYATQKENRILAFGTRQGAANNMAALGRMYDVVSTDLSGLVAEGQVINALKIRPYGDNGAKQYYTSVAAITVNGYKGSVPAPKDGPVEYITVPEATLRQIAVDQAYQVALTDWYTDTEIKTYNASGMTVYPESVTQHYLPGLTYRGPMYSRGPDSTLQMWQSVLTKDGKYVGGTSDATSEWTVIGWDCINMVGSSWSQVTTSKNYHTQSYLWYSDETILLGDMTNPTRTTKHETIITSNGDKVVYEAYAQLDLGDNLYGPGHNRIVTVPAQVVRKADGSIDPDLSCLAITEEAGTVQYRYLTPEGKIVTSEEKNVDSYLASHAGYTYLYGSSLRVDRMFTFRQLRDTFYVPFTLKEFREGKVEKQRVRAITDLTADNVVDECGIVMVQSNYHINKLTTTLADSTGKVLYENTKYGETHDFELSNYDPALTVLLKSLSAGSYKLTVDVASGPVTRVLGKPPVQRMFELDFAV
ncbi:MAG: hypothetical protein IJP02_04985 [Oscillospiraceae bacterium]|nr:hypothetical protein [Oscillospiraceae bacterium]